MRTKIFLMALSAVAACLPAASHADCDAYNKRFLKFNELKSSYAREMERVGAMKSLPQTDAALCHAALALAPQGNSLWMVPEPTCFETKAQMDAFAEQLHAMTTSVWKIARAFCPDAEKPRP